MLVVTTAHQDLLKSKLMLKLLLMLRLLLMLMLKLSLTRLLLMPLI
jgi:hypothetical protein